MAEENKTEVGEKKPEAGVNKPAEVRAPVIEPRDDLGRLEQIDWVSATIRRFRRGAHPDPEIDQLLQRRMTFSEKKCLSPYPFRVLCTWSLTVVFCGLSWLMLWVLFSVVGFHTFLREVSALMVTLMIALLAIGLSNPLPLYDEKMVEKSGLDSLRSLRLEIAEQDQRKKTDDGSASETR